MDRTRQVSRPLTQQAQDKAPAAKSLKEQFRAVADQVAAEAEQKTGAGRDKINTAITAITIAGITVGVIWAAKYVLLAFAGTIKAYKQLRRSIKEK